MKSAPTQRDHPSRANRHTAKTQTASLPAFGRDPTVLTAQDRTPALTPTDVLALQRTIGNQAVQRVLSDQALQSTEANAAESGSDVASTAPPSISHLSAQQSHAIQRSPKRLGKRVKNWFAGRKARVTQTKVQVPDEVEEAHEESEEEREIDTEFSEGSSAGSSGEGSPGGSASAGNARAIQNFQDEYYDKVSALHHVYKDISGKLTEFAATSRDYEIEDYSAQVFGNDKVIELLDQIEDHLEDSGEDDQVFAELIADMLIFASLIPTSVQEHGKKLGRKTHTRLTAQVITPSRLIEILVQLAQQAAVGGEASDARSLQGINFGDQDSVAQRMLKLSLANMTKTAREQLQGNDLFKSILSSPDIMGVIIGSGGMVEQNFLNTCAAAAVNKEVQVSVSNIAGLLIVGRGVTNHIEGMLGDSDLSDSLDSTHKRKGFKRMTIGQHARKRIDDAREAFDEIEREASAILAQQPVSMSELQQLMARWSRIMQKLSGVTQLEEGSKGVPILSKKRVKEAWATSAVVSFLSGSFLDRPMRRHRGVKEGSYRSALSETLDISTSASAEASDDLNATLGTDPAQRQQEMVKIWDKIFQSGGTEFNVPGHALYLQAVMKNSTRMFVVSDPKIASSHMYTLDELDNYARKYAKKKSAKEKFNIRKDIGTTTGVYWLQANIPVYTNASQLGSPNPDPKYIVTIKHTDRIVQARSEEKRGETWIWVDVRTENGNVAGYVEPKMLRGV